MEATQKVNFVVKWVMRKRVFRATLLLSIASSVLLILPAGYLFRGEHPSMAEGPVQVLTRYLKAAYARDFREAYRWISSEDRRLKDQKRYISERGPFNGFTLELAKKLSSFIEALPVENSFNDNRAIIKLQLRLPDANRLSQHLFDWDEERLNSLPVKEQRRKRNIQAPIS